jgi:hypothetical protein
MPRANASGIGESRLAVRVSSINVRGDGRCTLEERADPDNKPLGDGKANRMYF